jgi:hypothetical protein
MIFRRGEYTGNLKRKDKLSLSLWKTLFGKGSRLVVRQTKV